MGKKYDAISERHAAFIAEQHIYFVATAMADGRVNLSSKGMDSLRVLSPNRLLWLNLTGGGNETAAHLQHNDRMTIMFCAFEGAPLILRLYGHARAVFPGDEQWQELIRPFKPFPGARQIIDVDVDLVHTSCGFGVPHYEFIGDRPQLNAWAERKGATGIRDYWQEKNAISLDGLPICVPDEGGR